MAKDPKKRGLGKGLGALFESSPLVEPAPITKEKSSGKKAQAKGATEELGENTIYYIGLNDIKPNSNQPRKHFDEEKIEDLANSIIEHGIIQPLIVRKAKVGYEIVAGERRYRAARKAKLKEVPCIVREFSDEENMLIAIIENMQREDLDPIEEAEGINQMIKTFGLTQEQVSKSVGKSRPHISNTLRLLTLPEEIKGMLTRGELSPGHARVILSLNNDAKRLALAKKIAEEGLSVRSAEKLASGKKVSKSRPKPRPKSKEISWVESELKDILGTKVNIVANKKGGSIEIEYYSVEELNRLIDILRTLK